MVAAKNVPVPITVHLPSEEQMMNNRIIADIWDCKNHGRNIMNQSFIRAPQRRLLQLCFEA